MKIKYRMTGFARFVIFLIFFIPICYVGVSYYNGEDGLAKVKSIFTSDKSGNSSDEKGPISRDRFGIGDTKELQAKDDEIRKLQKRISELESEVKTLKNHQH